MSRSTFRVREGVVGSALCGVELISPNVACALSAGIRLVECRVQLHAAPSPRSRRIAAASARTSRRAVGGQVLEVAVLDADEVGFAEREVEMEVDQTRQSALPGRRRSADDARRRPRAGAC